MDVRDAGGIVVIVLRSADANTLIERAERSGLVHRGPARGPFALLGNDRNDAADRVRAVKSALRAAQYLDLGHVGGQKVSEIERTGAGVADVDAVDQHLGVVRIGA